MKKIDLLKESLSSLKSNKLRTSLTMLGIIIGVASVITMLSLGEGSKISIQQNIESLGSNILIVFPGVVQPGRGFVASGRGSAETLKSDDVKEISKIENVIAISPEVQRRFQIISDKGNNQNSTVLGVDETFFQVRNIEIAEGNLIVKQNVKAANRVAILGSQISKDLFGDDDPLGRKIRINNLTFKVVGVMKEKGSAGFINYDDFVIIPYPVMQKQLAGSDYFNSIAMKVESKENMGKVRQAIEERLTLLHRRTEPDFTIFSQQDILSTLTNVINIFTLFLSFIAGISLVVGGIGIMNMMLTTVTERTKEIGLRKALGAKKKDILKQILLESVLITFVGGVIGVIIGILLTTFISKFAKITTLISLKAVLISLLFSTFIGLVFGYYPAKRASNLNSIDALRYE